MSGLAGRVAMVTGAAGGLGKAFCETLLKRGSKVCLSDYNKEQGKAVKDELAKQYGSSNVTFKKCDVTLADELENSIKHTISTFGKMDILLNNAGIMDEGRYKQMLAVNLGGVMEGTFLGLKYMSKDQGGRGGVIINIASAAGVCPMAFGAAYAGSKYGIVGFTLSMGYHSKRKVSGVRVNCMCPTFADTGLLTLQNDDAVSSKAQFDKLLMKFKLMQPSQVAEAMPQLIEDESLNGAILLCESTGSRFLKLPFTLDEIPSQL